MRRFSGLNIVVAYPGTLGPRIPEPPAGFVPYDDGYQAINDEGDYLNWINDQWVMVQDIVPPSNPVIEDELDIMFALSSDDGENLVDDDESIMETYLGPPAA